MLNKPIPRSILQILTDFEAQDMRGQLIVMKGTEVRRLLAAARDHHPAALSAASVMPEQDAAPQPLPEGMVMDIPEGCTPADAMVLRTANHCLQAEIDRLTAENESLLSLSAGLDEHPDNYDGPCMCKLCMSYASDDEATPKPGEQP
jgi:hypothetical protein